MDAGPPPVRTSCVNRCSSVTRPAKLTVSPCSGTGHAHPSRPLRWVGEDRPRLILHMDVVLRGDCREPFADRGQLTEPLVELEVTLPDARSPIRCFSCCQARQHCARRVPTPRAERHRRASGRRARSVTLASDRGRYLSGRGVDPSGARRAQRPHVSTRKGPRHIDRPRATFHHSSR